MKRQEETQPRVLPVPEHPAQPNPRLPGPRSELRHFSPPKLPIRVRLRVACDFPKRRKTNCKKDVEAEISTPRDEFKPIISNSTLLPFVPPNSHVTIRSLV